MRFERRSPFYMAHSYVNISITKTTTSAVYLGSLIVLPVRRNERNVGLRSLFHVLSISKETMLAFVHSCSFLSIPCHAMQTTYNTIDP